MAATEKKQMWFWSSDDGVAPVVVKRKIAASQGVYMPGAPCYISQSGTVKIADTSDGTGDVIHGFLLDAPTAEHSANDEVRVALINNRQIWAVYVENAGTDAAATQAYVGNEYGLTVSATATQIGYTSLNVANSNDTVTVVDLASNVEPTKFTTSDSPGVVLVRFLSSVYEAEKA